MVGRSHGSSLLLAGQESRNVPLTRAKLAAFVTILSFIVDPFSQQLVQYEDCYRTDSTTVGTIPRTNYYFGNSHGVNDTLMNAMMIGAMSPPDRISTLVPAECPSGNCTYGLVSTIGVCHECHDISHQIQPGPQYKGQFILNITDLKAATLDSNATLMINQGNQPFTTLSGVNSWPDGFDIFPQVIAFDGQISYRNVPVKDPTETRCAFRPCVRTYNSTMQNAVLYETLKSTSNIGFRTFQNSHVADRNDLYRLALNRTVRNGQWANCETSTIEAPGYREVSIANIESAPNDTVIWENRTVWYPDDCVWRWARLSAIYFPVELSRILHNQTIEWVMDKDPVGTAPARRMWRNGTLDLSSVDKYMGDLAETITATIRQTGNASRAEWGAGEVQLRLTCARVYWKWFSFPAVLVFLALVFMAILLVQSPRAEPVWKSSSLVALFCQVDERLLGDGSGREETRDGMDDVARATRAQLVRDSEGKMVFR